MDKKAIERSDKKRKTSTFVFNQAHILCSNSYLRNYIRSRKHWSRCRSHYHQIWISKTYGLTMSRFLPWGEGDLHKTLPVPPRWHYLHHTSIKRPCYTHFANWSLWTLNEFVVLGRPWPSRSSTVHPDTFQGSLVSGKSHLLLLGFRYTLVKNINKK